MNGEGGMGRDSKKKWEGNTTCGERRGSGSRRGTMCNCVIGDIDDCEWG